MRKVAAFLALITLVLMLSACGGGATATTIARPTVVPTPTTAPTPAVKQELRVNLAAEPTSLDPMKSTSFPEASVINQVFQGLLGFKPDLSLQPVLAIQVPTVENGGISSDGLTYTFKLRPDITWGDGKKITAGDFVYSLRRIFDPEVASRHARLYTAIKGGPAYNQSAKAEPAARQSLRDAVAVTAPDDSTLRITLSSPSPTFLQKMALRYVYPLRQDVIESFGAKWTEAGNYLGNGPYVMTEWVHQDHITLEANPRYWGPQPKLTKITYRIITDPNAELAAYRNNELELSQVPPGTENAIASDPALGKEVVRSPQMFSFGLFFNNAVAPFNNVKVRQAFATAIDRRAWVDKVKNGVGKAATSWLPPGLPGYDPELGTEYSFNVAKAKQLLAEAGFPEGRNFPAVSFTFVDAGDGRVISQFLQAQMKDNLGIAINLEPLDPRAYGQRVIGARQFQFTGIGWGGGYPDAEAFLAPLFVGGAGNNIIQYKNAEFDRLAAEAARELDNAKRIGLWKKAQGIMIKEAPIAPFFYGERFFLKKTKVQGLVATPFDGAIPGDRRLAEISIGN